MKRRDPQSILFACSGRGLGGVQRSLIALASRLDPEEYDVTVLVDEHDGALAKELPTHVDVVVLPPSIVMISRLRFSVESLKWLISRPKTAASVLLYLKAHGSRQRRPFTEFLWTLEQDHVVAIPGLRDYYDVAISFAGLMGIWNQLVVDRVAAGKRVVWIHGDLSRIRSGTDSESHYLSRFDHVVTVSEECKRIICDLEPPLTQRVSVIYNIVDSREVWRKATGDSDVAVASEAWGTQVSVRLVSVGRLDPGKGYLSSLVAVAALVQGHVDVRWLIVGDGVQRDRLQQEIRRLGLERHVQLVGRVDNPLAYVYTSDVFFHPSRSEGHSIAIEEARILGKPVLATRFATVADQVRDGVDGLVVGFSALEILEGLKRIVLDDVLRAQLSTGSRSRPTYPDSIEKFHRLCAPNGLGD